MTLWTQRIPLKRQQQQHQQHGASLQKTAVQTNLQHMMCRRQQQQLKSSNGASQSFART